MGTEKRDETVQCEVTVSGERIALILPNRVGDAILALPVWLSQALMVPGFALLALAGFYMAWRFLRG